jgi:SAM-dependent methyltransferase
VPLSWFSLGLAQQSRLVRYLVSQGGNPRGPVGLLTAWMMGHRPSNVQRNRWVVSLLELEATDRILEIGSGPGVALGELARIAHAGYVCGIDHSKLMVRRARRRNRAAVRAGVLDVRVGTAEHLPHFDQPFDRVMAVNSLGFWPEPVARLRELHALLRPGGLIAIATQPRCPGATAATSEAAGIELLARLTAADFRNVRLERLDLQPPVSCALGIS